MTLTTDKIRTRVAERMKGVEKILAKETNLGPIRARPVTSHLMRAGGKRLRPALTLVCSYLGPEPESDRVESLAAAMELTHVASLYHDDVMDGSDLRRGVESAHMVFGTSAAILGGDILFARATKRIMAAGRYTQKFYSETFTRLCVGQLMETLGPEGEEDVRAYYINVLSDKTGSLIADSATQGVLGSAGPEREEEFLPVAEKVRAFGEKMGVAFQLADDYIDVMSDDATSGKDPGADIKAGVITMPIILLQEWSASGQLDSAGDSILDRWNRVTDLDSEARHQLVADIRRHDVMGEAKNIATTWAMDAINHLEPLGDTPVRELLVEYSVKSVERSH